MSRQRRSRGEAEETEQKTCAPKSAEEFDSFWSLYPKKRGKRDAQKAWKQTAKDRPSPEVLLSAVRAQAKSHQWSRDGGQFIPHPATWLRAGSWDDEVDERTPDTQGRGLVQPPDERTEADKAARFVSLAKTTLETNNYDGDAEALIAELSKLETRDQVHQRFTAATGMTVTGDPA